VIKPHIMIGRRNDRSLRVKSPIAVSRAKAMPVTTAAWSTAPGSRSNAYDSIGAKISACPSAATNSPTYCRDGLTRSAAAFAANHCMAMKPPSTSSQRACEPPSKKKLRMLSAMPRLKSRTSKAMNAARAPATCL